MLRRAIPCLFALCCACSAGKTDGDAPLTGDTGGDGGFDPDTTLDDGGFNLDGDPDAPPTGPKGCSADLTTVVDDKGNPLTKCPPDQGCLKGECVEACAAAAGSKGNVGCDFVVSTPSFYPGITPPCFAVFIANNWAKDVKITVTRGGASFPVTSFGRIPGAAADATAWPAIPATGVPPNKVGVLFMSSDPSSINAGYPLKCPVPQAIPGGTAVIGSGKGSAWHIKTDVPVSAYDILPYGGARSFLPSAELILPTSAWGTNYVAVVPRNPGAPNGPQWGQIVAYQDNTTVQVVPTSSLPAAGTVSAIAPGKLGKFTLNAGEFIQWQPSGEMSGSVISSDKEVAFVGGTGYLCLSSKTSSGGGCDSAHQQTLPVSALGFEYVGVPYATRRADLAPESIPYRFVGAVNGTTLKFDPAVAGAPASLNLGQVADFEATGPFKVSSQDKDHPFIVTQMMSGAKTTSGSRPGAVVDIFGLKDLGDEEHVNLLPPAQFLSKYVFFTDPTYGTTNLALTRVKGASGFKDVTIDCLGKVTGWKPVGSSGTYEVTDVDLVRAGKGTGTCTNGLHVASSDGAFGVMVWGIDTYASYAYPGGGNVGTINTVVVPPLPK
jgi:hypothetical protein